MRVLVTGGGGFLGQAIIKQLLARRDEVRSLARGDYPDLARLGVECIRGDVRDAQATQAACAGRDVVFHTAAVAGIWGPWEHFHGINVLGTRNVLAGCRKHGVPRLVYTSSPSVTFDGAPQENVNESVGYARHWLCHYAQTKAIGEQEALAANDHSLSVCALRPHLIWGPGDQHLIPRLMARAKSGQLRRVGDGANLIDMVYVDNAAEAHLQAAEKLAPNSAVAGKPYFISQGEPVNCWQWIDEILALAGIGPVKKSISLGSAWRIGAAMELAYRVFGLQSEPRMTRFLAAQLGMSHYFDIGAAQRDFGYRPAVSKAVGMQRLAESLVASSNH
jgi:nucleoside-diphosphate-sugar epimerase